MKENSVWIESNSIMNNLHLKKTLGLTDVVLLNVTAIVGLRWIALAAAGGNSTVLLWVLALLIFFIPQALAVITFTNLYPGEGGIYLWVKNTLWDFAGFLTGWCYWTSNLVYFPNLLVYIAGTSVFIWSADQLGWAASKFYIMLFSLFILWMVIIANLIGLEKGKWLSNIGGIGTWITGLLLIAFAAVVMIGQGPANSMSMDTFRIKGIDMENISFLASICFAFCGFELAPILAGEIRDPRKTILKSVFISGLIITAIYILGTLALLSAIPASEINIITGFLQGFSVVSNKIGLGWVNPIAALLITVGGIGGLMAWFTSSARLPFVAGIDRFLPPQFARLHPKYQTPHIAILIQGLISSVFIIMSFIGSTVEEAYLVLFDMTLLVYFVPYAAMFLAFIKIMTQTRSDRSTGPAWLNLLLGVSGFLTTLAAMGLSFLPPEDVSSKIWFELKIGGGFMAFLATGVLIYMFSQSSPGRDVE